MSGPRHLWSGDWERESEEAARERERRGSARSPDPSASAAPVPPNPAEPTQTEHPPTPVTRTLTPRAASPSDAASAATHSRRRRRLPRVPVTRAHLRLALIAVGVALLVIAGAYGLGRLTGGGPGSGRTADAKPAWLGVKLGVLQTGAVVVTKVVHGSPAASAGLQAGDVITQIQSRPVVAPVVVSEAVDALRAGDTVEIQWLHGSATRIARIHLVAKPGNSP